MEVVGLLKVCAARFHQTVIIVTHQEEVAQMADYIIRMADGKISGHMDNRAAAEANAACGQEG